MRRKNGKKMEEDRTKGWSWRDEAKYQLRRIASSYV